MTLSFTIPTTAAEVAAYIAAVRAHFARRASAPRYAHVTLPVLDRHVATLVALAQIGAIQLPASPEAACGALAAPLSALPSVSDLSKLLDQLRQKAAQLPALVQQAHDLADEAIAIVQEVAGAVAVLRATRDALVGAPATSGNVVVMPATSSNLLVGQATTQTTT